MPRTVSVTDDEILAAFSEVPSPIATAPDLAERVDLGPDGVRRRLRLLEEDGDLSSYEVGARATVWWRTD